MKSLNRLNFFIIIALTVLIFGSLSCGSDPVNIIQALEDEGDYSILLSALNTATIDGITLTEILEGPGPFTLFAPNNAAFNKLPTATLMNLLLPENNDQLVKILTYHVSEGALTAQVLIDRANSEDPMVISLEGQNIGLQNLDNSLILNSNSYVILPIYFRN